MPPATSDRELRRMIADLASLRPEDIAAVVRELDAEQRRTVERLLRDFSGFAVPPVIEGCDTTRLSPWLAQRLQPGLTDCTMTAEACDALRDCAAALFPAVVAQRSPGMFSRLAASLSGRGAP